jgi:DNA-binding CsgD family transcriptional regulator/5-methylcytosine-specific restriction endonuclease McrA
MKEEVRELLEQGVTRQRIARRLGISPTTVTRYARLLGFPDGNRRRSEFNWQAIQAYYDEGHTIDECRARFGFSYGAWDKAVVRGDLVPRPRGSGQLGRATRDLVENLLAKGLSQADVARKLSLSKSTVAYHARNLGRRADPRFARRYDWNQVQRAIDEEDLSMRACIRRFGFCAETWRRAVQRGEVTPLPHVMPLEKLLVDGRTTTNRAHLKTRLFKAGLKENRCERCGVTEWMGEPLSFELHHINGNKHDNRLENLQILCGNCHSQTHSWGGRNARHLRVVEGGLSDVG